MKRNYLILTDTRQQKEAHIIKEFDKQNILHIQTKLDSGDYMKVCFENGEPKKDYTTIIDTKKDLLEVCSNLAHTSEHARVIREVELAHSLGCKKFIFLIGENKIKSTSDLLNWKSKHTKVKGETLAKIMATFSKNHDCKFIIVPKQKMGAKIVELLDL